MDVPGLIAPLAPLDLAAVALLLALWAGIGLPIEAARTKRPSVSVLMAEYRREWMRHAITRDPRVFDAMIVTSLRDGTAFFASACMIAIGGGIALIGNAERLTGLAQDLDIGSASRLVLEIKLILPVLLLTNAFLKFVWSNRIFGYCCVMMGAVPNEPDDPMAAYRAGQAAELNITAAKSFNRGLRSVYFALGACAWLLGAVPLLVATALTAAIILRREYASHSRGVLRQMQPLPAAKEPPQ